MALDNFHPAVANWFRKTFEAPTEIQTKAWPEIQKRQNTLISAPTGSGKTLAAFLSAINDLIRQGLEGTLPDQTQVVYVSPLKALSNDIEWNLQIPLRGIEKELKDSSLPEVNYPVAEPRGNFKNQILTAYCHDTLYIALLPLPLPHPQHSLQNTHHSKTPLPKAPLSPLEIP